MIDPGILDKEAKIAEVDRSNMMGVVSSFPEMLEEAMGFSVNVDALGRPDVGNIVIAGMGGSAISGDVIAGAFQEKLDVPITVNREYKMPKFAKSGLFIAVSYSGNTEETLSSLEDAERRGFRIAAVTSGGKLSLIAKQKEYPLITVPSGVQPRAALPYLLTSVIMILEGAGILHEASAEVKEAIKTLKPLRDEYLKERKLNPVKQLAQRLCDKIPLVYGCDGITGAAAKRFVAQFNENSKTMAHHAVFPELNHNEMVSLAGLERGGHAFALIVLRDDGDLEKTKKRIEITKSLVSSKLGGVTEISSSGKGRLSRLLSLILYGDFLSVYLAVLKGIDPTPVEVIERFKRELAR
jgi:glucose/mannose-6-phosphate isomerase